MTESNMADSAGGVSVTGPDAATWAAAVGHADVDDHAGGFEPFWVGFSAFDAASMVDLMGESTRLINHETARRCAWIATRHDQIYAEWADASAALADQVQDRRERFTDEYDQLIGEVGAVIGRGAGAARTLIELSLALRDRTPQVFEKLFEGLISETVARTLVNRAAAVTDRALLHRYDTVVAALLGRKVARGTAPVTDRAARRLADGVLAKLDPDAIPTPTSGRRRGVWFERRRDGLAELAAVTHCEDGAYLDREIEAIAVTVCRHDPRTLDERRADGLVALVQGYRTLGCQCETEGCDKQVQQPKHATVEAKTIADVTVVINESTLTEADDLPALIDDQPVPARIARAVIARVTESWIRPLGKVIGEKGGVADTIGEQIAGPTSHPAARPRQRRGSGKPRSRVCAHNMAGYRPSALQAKFLEIRYPECVFPGCEVPFRRCQIDHVTERNHRNPTAGGQTRIGNLVPLCPRHHRIKTEQNWLSDVLPDGSVEWHTPTGHTYRTATITGDDLFPDLDLIEWLDPTRTVTPPAAAADKPGRAEIRNNNRENKRTHYRRERERLHQQHPDDPRWTDEPPPF